ncbi:MAG: LPS export ABC transporter ATP-binding protein [Deltaproteobacteria bacterium]|nr:LPS export ABC transporter ATP-binding protein [Deltaproteobacteria bacterium]
MNHSLIVKGIMKAYNGRKVVDNLNLQVHTKEVVGLLGPNGAGKTTTFYIIMGIVRPEKGHIYLDDKDITTYPMHLRARLGINYLPQEASIFRKMTVEENILSILQTFNLSSSDQKRRLTQLLQELRLSHLAKRRANTLSGGERRKVEITRALATSPIFMVLDEPFAGIDPIAVGEIKQIILGLKLRGIGVLISDHNVRETLEVCDRAYILNEGKVIETGGPEDIVNSHLVRQFYLGKDFRL